MKLENIFLNEEIEIQKRIVNFLNNNSELKPLYAINPYNVICKDEVLNRNFSVQLVKNSVRVVAIQ